MAWLDSYAPSSQRKQTSTRPVLINRYQYALFDLVLELADRLGDQSPDGFRKNVLRSNLYHAGSVSARELRGTHFSFKHLVFGMLELVLSVPLV